MNLDHFEHMDADVLRSAILRVMNDCEHPMTTVYGVCRKLKNPQQSSTNRFYARVYRNMERLVDDNQLWVMRGTRDPSIYLSKHVIKGHKENEMGEIPF